MNLEKGKVHGEMNFNSIVFQGSAIRLTLRDE